ncbi:VOC family protein [Dinoroseobacter sp. PD6]|uniref:VOC family protein n=1 Tax=Dinoroseobacter sp. PD6 TaxID=3028384 RepID=UPI00237A45BF|nr:VOC family protein [Dinoroseobacter sp. PD6]MDD9717856.1 VOC family protein [Dinoroseobacter sp. PD6]
MQYDTVDAVTFGRSLRGLGINLLVQDAQRSIAFLTEVFGMTAHQPTRDFAILTYGDAVFQIHADATYHAHPLPSLLPESGPRGGGVELRLYGCDPDAAAARAEAAGGLILQGATDKPHGLREAVILDPDGFAWVPGRAL